MKLALLLTLFLSCKPPESAYFAIIVLTPGACRVFVDGIEVEQGVAYEVAPFYGTVTMVVELRHGGRVTRVLCEVEAGYKHVFRLAREVSWDERASR